MKCTQGEARRDSGESVTRRRRVIKLTVHCGMPTDHWYAMHCRHAHIRFLCRSKWMACLRRSAHVCWNALRTQMSRCCVFGQTKFIEITHFVRNSKESQCSMHVAKCYCVRSVRAVFLSIRLLVQYLWSHFLSVCSFRRGSFGCKTLHRGIAWNSIGRVLNGFIAVLIGLRKSA